MAFPTPFGRYVLLQKLATGGMAEIFLAKSLGEGGFAKTCVIKRVLPHLAANASFVEMFLDEARLAARLNHPGIVQIFDLGHIDDDYYLAMEYLAGEDVESIISRSRARDRAVPLDVAARIATSAADALHFAHQIRADDGRPLGLVHRDISPSNLRVTYQGSVKVLDFGIAQAGQRLHATEVGVIKGKAPYMSPEQARGQPLDRRSDVWSLGVCLHELLTGVSLFPRGTSASTGIAVLQMRVPPPSERRPEIPPAMDELVLKALERDPARRFASAEEFSLALQEFLGNRTWAPESRHLGLYLRDLFGPERELAALSLAQAPLVAARGPGTEALEPAGPLTAPTDAVVTAPRRALGRPALAAVSGAAVLLAMGVFLWGWGLRRPAPVARPAVIVPTRFTAIIDSLPTDAAIFLDGERRVERTPVTVGDLAAGRYELRLVKDGFEPAHAFFELGPGKPPAVLTLTLQRAVPEVAPPAEASEPVDAPALVGVVTTPRPRLRPTEAKRSASTGQLTVDSNITARVKLDGVELGETPVRRRRVVAGEHVLLLEQPALGLSQSLKVQVKADQERTETVRFRKGKLTVTADPWADVYLDGQRLGQTPLAGREVWEGRHQLRLSGPDREKTRTVTIRPAETTVVNEQFP